MLNLLLWLVILALVFIGIPRLLLRSAQKVIHPGNRVDVRRRFSMAEYRKIMNRAGWRCEHHTPLFGRCEQTVDLEADHVQPHARRGQTNVENSQALCHSHNVEKSAKVPFWWNLAALERRRVKYFPTGADRRVVRYGPPSTTKPARKGH